MARPAEMNSSNDINGVLKEASRPATFENPDNKQYTKEKETRTGVLSESKDEFTLLNSSIDDDRPYKIAVLGAGLSGILAGIRQA